MWEPAEPGARLWPPWCLRSLRSTTALSSPCRVPRVCIAAVACTSTALRRTYRRVPLTYPPTLVYTGGCAQWFATADALSGWHFVWETIKGWSPPAKSHLEIPLAEGTWGIAPGRAQGKPGVQAGLAASRRGTG